MKWIKVSDQLPKAGVAVLARCLYSEHHNTYRQFVGEYHGKHVSEASPDSEFSDYDEATDYFFIPEGWYEQTLWNDEHSSMLLTLDVTHWMELPKAPN